MNTATEVPRPATLADVLDDPALFAPLPNGPKKKDGTPKDRGTRLRAWSYVPNVIFHAYKRRHPEPPMQRREWVGSELVWHDDEDLRAQHDAWFAARPESDPEKVTLEWFVRYVDLRDFHRSSHLGRTMIDEVRRGIEARGFRISNDLDEEAARAPTVELTRDTLLARVSDLLMRTGADDAPRLVAELERRLSAS